MLNHNLIEVPPVLDRRARLLGPQRVLLLGGKQELTNAISQRTGCSSNNSKTLSGEETKPVSSFGQIVANQILPEADMRILGMDASLALRRHFCSRSTQLIAPLARYLNSLIPSPTEVHHARKATMTLSTYTPTLSSSSFNDSPAASPMSTYSSPAFKSSISGTSISSSTPSGSPYIGAKGHGPLQLKPFNTAHFFASLKAHGTTLPFKSTSKRTEFYERYIPVRIFFLSIMAHFFSLIIMQMAEVSRLWDMACPARTNRADCFERRTASACEHTPNWQHYLYCYYYSCSYMSYGASRRLNGGRPTLLGIVLYTELYSRCFLCCLSC